MLKTHRSVAVVASAAAALTVAISGPALASPGESQTPIDFTADVVDVADLPPLRPVYSRRASVTITNTGSPNEEATIRADVPAGLGVVHVGGRVYELVQFHWHTPSEHSIEGQRSRLELHLVHRGPAGELLVVGVFVERGRHDATTARIFRDLPAHEGDSRVIRSFNLAGLLPERLDSLRYSGSLTTPPFTEPVAWIVLTTPIDASERQLHAFEELFEDGNSRETQPLNGRRVLTDADPDEIFTTG